ncbi:hypothetical protein C1646_767140 [Rhizophagus diaphanus]|nr:hypothetical protein C1646_767140 [Rhizophagus diaphanus] [Rhizophagus sp. MUCL 43196]
MQQILKVFIVLAFIIAVIATPVPIQKRQGKSPKCPTPPKESSQSDTYPVYSTGDELMPTKKKMQQILKIFIVLAFIIAVIATPVPVQKRQSKSPKCPTPPKESTESDTYPVSSDGDELMPFNCS